MDEVVRLLVANSCTIRTAALTSARASIDDLLVGYAAPAAKLPCKRLRPRERYVNHYSSLRPTLPKTIPIPRHGLRSGGFRGGRFVREHDASGVQSRRTGIEKIEARSGLRAVSLSNTADNDGIAS